MAIRKPTHYNISVTTTEAEQVLTGLGFGMFASYTDTTNKVLISFDGANYYTLAANVPNILDGISFNRFYVKTSAGSISATFIVKQ